MTTLPDLVCLSHLRWDFVYQRPQHLMSRFARATRLFFVEEFVRDEGPPRLEIRLEAANLYIVVPHLPHGTPWEGVEPELQRLLAGMWEDYAISQRPLLWFYTPMALEWLPPLEPSAIVYDCMDELTLFHAPPPALLEREARLFELADVVFTGGHSLYEAKRERHPNVHCFPSSIDRAHFSRAREAQPDPADQAALPRPRLGFFGVIDERLDLDLVAAVADARPDWQIVLLGPVVKIDEGSLPRRANLHYLGQKPYAELPRYLAGWDVAIMPFARNDATRFISPTKTPEYLAGGAPVVSTPVRDVVRGYGERGLVQIAGDAPSFVAAVERALEQRGDARWLAEVDAALATDAWDRTWQGMVREIEAVLPTVRVATR